MDPLSLDGEGFDGIRLGYQPEELAKMFFEFSRAHPTIHKELRQFQLVERHRFMEAEERTSSGEHRLEWSDAHQRFCALIEKLMREFHTEVACTEEEFIGAMMECKTEGSKWWTPFCQLVDTSEYERFARQLQDNVCLCCGEPFLAYQSGNLLRMLLDYMKDRPDICKRVREFQLQERFCFMNAQEDVHRGEHRLEWSDAHRRFVAIIEEVIGDFIRQSNCTEQELFKAMRECMQGCTSEWPPFAKLLDVTDYREFARMMQQNYCLCCGESFSGYSPEEIGRKLAEYLEAHPVIHEELRAFQERERYQFFNVEERVDCGEHCLEWTAIHHRFLQMIDVHIRAFMEEIQCSEQEFMHALAEGKKGDGSSRPLALLSMLLNTGDYVSFAQMFQSNICFCCGRSFTSGQDLGQMQNNMMQMQNN